MSLSQLLLATIRLLRSSITSPARAKIGMMQLGSALEAASSEVRNRERISKPSVKEAWTMASVAVFGAETADEAIVGEEQIMHLGEGEVP